MSNNKKGGYGLLDELEEATEKPKKKPDKKLLINKEPAVEELGKKMVSAPSGKLDIRDILGRAGKTGEDKKSEDKAYIFDTEEKLNEVLESEETVEEVGRKMDELLGKEDSDEEIIGESETTTSGLMGLAEEEEDLDLGLEENNEPPLMEETYEEFGLPEQQPMPESRPAEDEEDNGTDSMSSADFVIEEEAHQGTEDILEESEIPSPETQETKKKEGAKPLPLPEKKEMGGIQIDMGEAKGRDAMPPPAPSAPVQTRPGAHTAIGIKPKPPDAKKDENEEYAAAGLRTLGGVYAEALKYPQVYTEDDIKRHGLDKKEPVPRVSSDSIGLPRVIMPASKEKGGVSDDAETEALEKEGTTGEAKTREAETRAVEESMPTKGKPEEKKPRLPKLRAMPAPKGKGEAEDDEETKALRTKAPEATTDEQIKILKSLERRFKRWGLVDGKNTDVVLDDFATNVVGRVLKNNPQLLAKMVAELIKKDDIIRSILFNERDGLLKEIPAEVRKIKDETAGLRDEVGDRVRSLKGLETQVNNLTSAAEDARDAAQKAEDAAADVDGKVSGAVKEAKRYTDKTAETLEDAVDEEIAEKMKEAKGHTDKTAETLEGAVDEEIKEVKEGLSKEMDEKADKAKKDAVEEAKDHTNTQVESAKEEATQAVKDARSHAEKVTGEKADEAKKALEVAVKELKENVVGPVETALKTMLGSGYQKAKVAGEAVDAIAVTATVGALSDARYVEAVDVLGREYGKGVARDALEKISEMSAEELAMSQQMYDEKGELDVEKAYAILKHANNILNR